MGFLNNFVIHDVGNGLTFFLLRIFLPQLNTLDTFFLKIFNHYKINYDIWSLKYCSTAVITSVLFENFYHFQLLLRFGNRQ